MVSRFLERIWIFGHGHRRIHRRFCASYGKRSAVVAVPRHGAQSFGIVNFCDNRKHFGRFQLLLYCPSCQTRMGGEIIQCFAQAHGTRQTHRAKSGRMGGIPVVCTVVGNSYSVDFRLYASQPFEICLHNDIGKIYTLPYSCALIYRSCGAAVQIRSCLNFLEK